MPSQQSFAAQCHMTIVQKSQKGSCLIGHPIRMVPSPFASMEIPFHWPAGPSGRLGARADLRSADYLARSSLALHRDGRGVSPPISAEKVMKF